MPTSTQHIPKYFSQFKPSTVQIVALARLARRAGAGTLPYSKVQYRGAFLSLFFSTIFALFFQHFFIRFFVVVNFRFFMVVSLFDFSTIFGFYY